MVKVKYNARKLRADRLGAEREIPIDDSVDIGIFASDKRNEKALVLEKRRITQPQVELEIIVNEVPTRVGIDPYNKLIDHNPEDNVLAGTKAE